MAAAVSGQDIARVLAEDVHGGVLRAGDMIPSEKLIQHQKGHRPRVVAPSLSHAMASAVEASGYFFRDSEGNAHLEQARLFLETSLVRYAAEFATQAQIAKMIAAIESGDAAINDLPAFRNADVRFHRILAEVPGNPIFVALHDSFVDRLMRGRTAPPDVPGHNRRINDEHKAIVQALVSKNADVAVAELTRHLTRNYAVYVHHALAPAGVRPFTATTQG